MASPQVSTRDLPSELVDRIIDHLHDDDETLRVCACVHSSWTPASRAHLFAAIEISSLQACTKLVEILARSLWIARYVKHLTINNARNFFLHRVVRDVEGPNAAARIGELLPDVESLQLYGVKVLPSEDPVVCQFVRTSFLRIKKLDLLAVSASSRSVLQEYILRPRPSICIASFHSVTISNPLGPAIPFISYSELEIDSLGLSMLIRANEERALSESSLLGPSVVETLRVTQIERRDLVMVSRTLCMIGDSLKTLQLRTYADDDRRYPDELTSIVLKYSKGLETLVWTDHTPCVETIGNDLACMLMHASSKRLQAAHIYLSIHQINLSLDHVRISERWQNFAQLVESNTFPELTFLSIHLRHNLSWFSDAQTSLAKECMRVLRGLFPRLHSKGTLRILVTGTVPFDYPI